MCQKLNSEKQLTYGTDISSLPVISLENIKLKILEIRFNKTVTLFVCKFLIYKYLHRPNSVTNGLRWPENYTYLPHV